MHRVLSSLVALSFAAALPNAGYAEDQPDGEQAATSHYTTAETPLGTLFDDPDAMAVLEKHIPRLVANDQFKMAREITLKDIQGFAPEALSDETLAAIDADLAMLPAR